MSKALSLFTSLGITMAASAWIGWLIGTTIDRALHTYPWFTLFFSLSGIGAGFKGVFRLIREDEDEKRK